jgi:amidase
MGIIQDYEQYDSLGLAELVRQRQVTALDKMAERSLARTPFTQLANLCGLPAMSVPLHWTPDELPCGSHFTAPFSEEAVLFRLAAQLEEASPWFNRRPRMTRQ